MMLLYRLLRAAAVLILVGLGCILLGGLLAASGIPFVVVVGAFLVQWAWVIAFACAIWYFAVGSPWPLR